MLALALIPVPAGAQDRPSHTPPTQTAGQPAADDSGDFTQDGFKFHRMGPAGMLPTTYMITDIAKSNPAGQMILRQGGSTTFMAFPGYDQTKLEAAFKSHANGGGEPGQPAQAGASPSPATGTGEAHFDAATKTVTLPGDRVVTFIDNENAEVKLPSVAGVQTYKIHYHGSSAMGGAKVWARSQQGNTGMGSGLSGLGGSGVTITLAPSNGMPGGQLYDTSQGPTWATCTPSSHGSSRLWTRCARLPML
jgi:hypothetical protein